MYGFHFTHKIHTELQLLPMNAIHPPFSATVKQYIHVQIYKIYVYLFDVRLFVCMPNELRKSYPRVPYHMRPHEPDEVQLWENNEIKLKLGWAIWHPQPPPVHRHTHTQTQNAHRHHHSCTCFLVCVCVSVMYIRVFAFIVRVYGDVKTSSGLHIFMSSITHVAKDAGKMGAHENGHTAHAQHTVRKGCMSVCGVCAM